MVDVNGDNVFELIIADGSGRIHVLNGVEKNSPGFLSRVICAVVQKIVLRFNRYRRSTICLLLHPPQVIWMVMVTSRSLRHIWWSVCMAP